MTISFEQVAAKLAEHEVALSEMYAQFARTFTVDADLWLSLSRDEARHAAWIDEVRQSVGAGSMQPAETTARQQAIDQAIQYVRGLAERCRSSKMTRVQAHALARDVENGMLERKLFAVLGGASPDFAKLQDALNRETEEHRDRITRAMARFSAPPRDGRTSA